jgi:hypothetical protein
MMKERLKLIHQRHYELQCQKWDANKEVKLDAKNRLDKFISNVVDGMDQFISNVKTRKWFPNYNKQ